MRLHEVHRIEPVKSMAGRSHPGELIAFRGMTGARHAHGARGTAMVLVSVRSDHSVMPARPAAM
jgi:hypothetical protein